MWPQHGKTAILSASTVLSLCWCTATGLDLSASTVHRRLLRTGLVARIPLCQLPLSIDHQCLRLPQAHEHHHWQAEWRNIVFLEESHFSMSYSDDCIHGQRYARESSLWVCILQGHRGPTPSVMVWGAIGYSMWSHVLHIEGNLNSNRYIREVLRPEVLPVLQATPHAIFQQDNALPHMARIVQSLLTKMTGITASLACTFARHVAHRTCMGYGWLATYSSESSSTYPWHFVDSYTNCMEGHSPGWYPGPLWFHTTRHRDSDCSAWRLHTILKSHTHRSCTVL